MRNKIQNRKSLTLLSEEEKIAWCNRWKASKLSMVEFCKIHPVAKSSLYGWHRRFFSSHDARGTPAFIPVLPVAKPQNEQEIISIELTLANSTTAKIYVPLGSAVNLIQELSHAATVIR